MAEMRGGAQFRGWGQDRYMSASIYNAINILKYITILANSDPKKANPELPEPFPLPDKDVKRKRAEKEGSFASITKQLLAKAKARKAAEANE